MTDQIWFEKYRPQTLADLCISAENREILLNYGKNIPNLLFCGVQGSGKTSLARILVQDVLKCDYLYVNASDETGIDNIRVKVTGFAQTKSIDGELKVIILDECDFLTLSAQAALRNLMESYTDTTRFILTGNYRHKIIPALQSRCQSLDIKPSLVDAVNRCVKILRAENVEIDKASGRSLVALVKRHFPDLRKCINEMQKFCIDGKLVVAEAGDNNELLTLIWDNLKAGETLATRKYLIENDNIFNSEWDQLLTDLLNYVYSSKIDDINKKMMIIKIAEHLDISTRVADKEINFFACLLNLEDYATAG
jgi:DNA polymerase III delta prime subunit|tara:strand:- start:8475 stop:9401 length:927 start_codon:yes stop_codon:yes gene_type:complete